jgi:hypothetical protein
MEKRVWENENLRMIKSALNFTLPNLSVKKPHVCNIKACVLGSDV